jgi:hypothetical protein
VSWTAALDAVDSNRARCSWSELDGFLNNCRTTQSFGRPLTAKRMEQLIRLYKDVTTEKTVTTSGRFGGDLSPLAEKLRREANG